MSTKKEDQMNEKLMDKYNGAFTKVDGRPIALMGHRTDYAEIEDALIYYQVDHPAMTQVAFASLEEAQEIVNRCTGILIGAGAYNTDITKVVYYGRDS